MKTIAAISTAPGTSGIGIIRMSGSDCFNILNKIFKPKSGKINPKGYTIQYGVIVNPMDNSTVDEVLVSYFEAPKSYTAENMCEINSHGNLIISKKILELCIASGAELAEPGEFTKRAFLNGRIDLSQAEAVADIINSKTELETETAEKQLEGYLSKKIREIRKEGISLMSDIEASIDYPEYDVEEVSRRKLIEVLEKIDEQLKELECSFERGKLLKDGIKTVIIGKPNAGKSSLLNALLKEDRAIVTEFAGTTRDTIEEFINIDGILLKIIDTAGIRETDNEIEKIGIEKTKKIAKEADLIIAIFDGSKALEDEDKKIIEIAKEKTSIIVINKQDIVEPNEGIINMLSFGKPVVKISALEQQGIDCLYKEISKLFEADKIKNDSFYMITNIRHKKLIENARKNILQARKTVDDKMPIDIVSIQIKEALENLGKITGETTSEEIIKDIFSKFCLGK